MYTPMILLDASWWAENKPYEDHPVEGRFRELERIYRQRLNVLTDTEEQWSKETKPTDNKLCPLDELAQAYAEAMWIVRCIKEEATNDRQ